MLAHPRNTRKTIHGATRLTFVVVLAMLTACSTSKPSGTIEAERKERQRAYATDCRRHPEHYGFPYSKEELMRTTQSLEASMPVQELVTYCSKVAWILAGQPIL